LGGRASSRERSSGHRVLLDGLVDGEAADARMRAAAVGDDEGDQDLGNRVLDNMAFTI